jgi:hypothetical protein
MSIVDLRTMLIDNHPIMSSENLFSTVFMSGCIIYDTLLACGIVLEQLLRKGLKQQYGDNSRLIPNINLLQETILREYIGFIRRVGSELPTRAFGIDL